MTLFTSSSRPRPLLGAPGAEERVEARMPWILGLVLGWAVAVLLRLVWVQGLQHARYRARAEAQHQTRVPIAPIRGEIRDRRGESLAISLKVESLFCNPPAFYPDYRGGKGEEAVWGNPDRKLAEQVAARLAPALEMPRSMVLERLLRKRPFVWIDRQMEPGRTAAVKALIQQHEWEGLDFLPESRRYYPRGSLACQILGFTDIDGNGQLGIERTFQDQLAGQPGELLAPRDAKGRLLILQENYAKIPVNGASLQLTLDSTIQHIVEEALEDAVRLSRPATAYAVVVDPNTGEILAMGGTPTFDPNHLLPPKFRNRDPKDFTPAEREEYRKELERQRAARKVHPVEDAYEPGSTMKIFTAAIALEERKVHLGEKIDCMGGRWRFDKTLTITDTHSHGVLTFEEVLWQSSNVGAAKIGLRLEPAVHYRYLRDFGFGQQTGLNFPGETAGSLMAPDRWSGTTQPTFCYGYGLSTSPLQILMAGCALANGGKLMRPLLVRRMFNDQGALLKPFDPVVRKQVISEETSSLMREALKGVITMGTAKKAKLEGVDAFGKTGTARKIINGKYDPRRHFASFLGFFPADKPQYGMLFMLDDPAGDVTGGDVAAPLFKKIGDAILRYRANVAADQREPDLKLSLRDWPSSESSEAAIHVEVGKVPDVRGLSLKAAIQRVVMAGGDPRIEGTPHGAMATRVSAQSPEPGTALKPGGKVTLTVGGGGP
jgi:cell division protein FtsI (penicillin-binding protein 3)